MPNWAFTRNAFVGKKDDLEKLKKVIQTSIKNSHSTKLCDKEWLGNIVKTYGLDTNTIPCKGNVLSVYYKKEPTLHLIVETQDAWDANAEMWKAIIKASELPITYHYCSEEPLSDYFARSNGSEQFFPEKYRLEINFVDRDSEIEYLKTDSEVINEVNKYTKCEFTTIEEIENLIYDMDDPIENIESITLLTITEDNPDEMTEEMIRCKDCAYLYEGEHGEWMCDDWQKNIHEVTNDKCALTQTTSNKL